MPFPNPDTQFKPGQSGNPKGTPKGTKHINTHIQELLEDEKFTIQILEGYEVKEYKGKPLTAILQAQVRLALQSKDEAIRIKATELLLKHGWSAKQELDLTTNGESLGAADPVLAADFSDFLKNKTKS